MVSLQKSHSIITYYYGYDCGLFCWNVKVQTNNKQPQCWPGWYNRRSMTCKEAMIDRQSIQWIDPSAAPHTDTNTALTNDFCLTVCSCSYYAATNPPLSPPHLPPAQTEWHIRNSFLRTTSWSPSVRYSCLVWSLPCSLWYVTVYQSMVVS